MERKTVRRTGEKAGEKLVILQGFRVSSGCRSLRLSSDLNVLMAMSVQVLAKVF